MTTGKMKKIIGIMLALMLVFALAGCGSKSESAETQEPENVTEEQAPETDETAETPEAEVTADSGDYDIASNLMLAGGGDEKAIVTDHFTISLTHGSSWDYEINSKMSITIYNVASREADWGGHLVTIMAFDPGDTSYEVFPSYHMIGEKDGKVYIAQYPSDVQCDLSNEQTKADYEAVFAEVQKINEGAEDSPLVLN